MTDRYASPCQTSPTSSEDQPALKSMQLDKLMSKARLARVRLVDDRRHLARRAAASRSSRELGDGLRRSRHQSGRKGDALQRDPDNSRE